MTAYDADNVFARILRGEIPSHKVYEDEKTVVIMDIMPRADGHALVLPKTPSRNLLDIAPADLAAVYATAQKVARAAMRAFGAEGVTLQQFNEPAGGQEVYHTHVHVLPRWADVKLRPPGRMAPAEEVKAHAEKLRQALKS